MHCQEETEGEREHQRRDMERMRGERWGREEESVTAVACASTCVCLWMSVAACMHVSLHMFIHECMCVCVQPGGVGGCGGYTGSYK